MKNNTIKQFLTSLDQWLLKNRPVIWRTQIHYVLFYCLIVNVGVFAAYHLFPMTTNNMPGRDGITYFLIGVFTMACFAILFWGFSSLKIPIRSNQFSSFLFAGILYWLGVAAICSTVWVTLKSLENKVAGLKNDSSITRYHEVADQFNKEFRIPANVKTTDKIEHWNSLDKKGKDKLFNSLYGMTYSKYKKFNSKIRTIRRANENKDWLSVKYHYQLVWWVFLIGLVVLPMMAILLSMISIQTAIFLGFAQFLTCTGMILVPISTYHFGKSYFLLTSFLFGLVCVVRINHKLIHWLKLFVATLIPLTILIIIDNGALRQLFNYNFGYYVFSRNLVLTLVSVVLVSFVSYLYFKTINQPQTA